MRMAEKEGMLVIMEIGICTILRGQQSGSQPLGRPTELPTTSYTKVEWPTSQVEVNKLVKQSPGGGVFVAATESITC